MSPDAPLPPDVRALVFDCDGTLVDSMPAHHRAWKEALAPHGLVFPDERFRALAGVPAIATVEILAREQGVACDPVAIAREKDALYLALGDHGRAIDVVVAIAKRERGTRKLAVASGNVTSLVLATLEAAHIRELFEVVVGADQVARGKPAPDMFLRTAELLAVPPSACIVYEDGDPGLDAARTAGMRAVDVRPWLVRPSQRA